MISIALYHVCAIKIHAHKTMHILQEHIQQRDVPLHTLEWEGGIRFKVRVRRTVSQKWA